MWAITNRTPYAAERSWVQDKQANKVWIVVVKATFDIGTDGATHLSDEQVPVLRSAKHEGDPVNSSLAYGADLLGVKPCTDVLVRARAWAPRGRQVTVTDVEVAVGSLQKHLRVFGDRQWRRSIGMGWVPSQPLPFESMPIQYERAYGGWDRGALDPVEHRLESRNPIGVGFVTRPEHCERTRLPNVEYPDRLISSWKDRPDPAGLNAIDCHWSPRRELAGTYDERWLNERFPLWADDFNPRYHNWAPMDQQSTAYLRGGEPVSLINLSADGRLVFRLPKIFPFFETRFGHERVEHRPQLATIVLEPDFPRVILAWQTALICNHRADELDSTVITEKRFL